MGPEGCEGCSLRDGTVLVLRSWLSLQAHPGMESGTLGHEVPLEKCVHKAQIPSPPWVPLLVFHRITEHGITEMQGGWVRRAFPSPTPAMGWMLPPKLRLSQVHLWPQTPPRMGHQQFLSLQYSNQRKKAMGTALHLLAKLISSRCVPPMNQCRWTHQCLLNFLVFFLGETTTLSIRVCPTASHGDLSSPEAELLEQLRTMLSVL